MPLKQSKSRPAKPTFITGPYKVKIEGTSTGRSPVICTAGPHFSDGSEREIAELETFEVCPSRVVNVKAKWRRLKEAGEIEATAFLLAAAPEMYAALKTILLNADVEDLLHSHDGILRMIREAVAKADERGLTAQRKVHSAELGHYGAR